MLFLSPVRIKNKNDTLNYARFFSKKAGLKKFFDAGKRASYQFTVF